MFWTKHIVVEADARPRALPPPRRYVRDSEGRKASGGLENQPGEGHTNSNRCTKSGIVLLTSLYSIFLSSRRSSLPTALQHGMGTDIPPCPHRKHEFSRRIVVITCHVSRYSPMLFVVKFLTRSTTNGAQACLCI